MTSKDLSQQVGATYKMLRLGLAAIAFGLPLVLAIGGYLVGHLPLARSMSAYYHASDPLNPAMGAAGQGVMRNAFVGLLFAVSGFLLAYQGYSKLEDYALNLAGILAVGIAVLFFVSIAYVCIWRAGDTLPLIKDEAVRKSYLRTYRLLGGAMVLLPLLAFALD